MNWTKITQRKVQLELDTPLQFTLLNRNFEPMEGTSITDYLFADGLMRKHGNRILVSTSSESKQEIALCSQRKIFAVIKLSDDREIMVRHVQAIDVHDFPKAVALLAVPTMATQVRVQSYPSETDKMCRIEYRANRFPYLHIPEQWAAMFARQGQTPNQTPRQSQPPSRQQTPRQGSAPRHDFPTTSWMPNTATPIPTLVPIPDFAQLRWSQMYGGPQVPATATAVAEAQPDEAASNTDELVPYTPEKKETTSTRWFEMPAKLAGTTTARAIAAGLKVHGGRPYLPADKVEEAVQFAQLYEAFQENPKELRAVLHNRPEWVVLGCWVTRDFIQWALRLERIQKKYTLAH